MTDEPNKIRSQKLHDRRVEQVRRKRYEPTPEAAADRDAEAFAKAFREGLRQLRECD